MISFFRKIRQKLLSQNRVTRYLAYAIGEIFLVMIGILLALKVNEWRDLRLKKEKELQTINLLIRDLVDDEKNLQVFEFGVKEQEANVIKLLESIKDRKSTDSILNYTQGGLGVWLYRPSYPTYEGLKQSGALDIISNPEMRDMIIQYHEEIVTYLDDLRESYKIDNEKAREAFEPYLGYRYRDGKWEQEGNFDLLHLASDSKAINLLSQAGRQRAWILIRLREIFFKENQALSDSLSKYKVSIH